jgi:hypothetical protein
VRFLLGAVPGTGNRCTLSVAAQLVAACCGITAADSPAAAAGKVTRTVRRLIPGEEQAAQLTGLLGPLAATVPAAAADDVLAMLDGLRVLLGARASRHPTVLVIDDLHRSHEMLLDFVEQLTGPGMSVPLLVVATTRPALFERRASWGGGPRNATTITLDPLSNAAIDRLLELLELPGTMESGGGTGTHLGTLVADHGAEQRTRRRFLRFALSTRVAARSRSAGVSETPARMFDAVRADPPTSREVLSSQRWRRDEQPNCAAS